LRGTIRSDLVAIMLTASARRAGIAAGVVLLAIAGKVMGCGAPLGKVTWGGQVFQQCWFGEDCSLMPKTYCGVFVCLCEVEGEVYCEATNSCVPQAMCPFEADGGGGGAGAGGAGGAGGMPMSVCDEAADCPQPPDARCGYAECKEGKCLLVITPGEASSQKRGDCKAVYCDPAGNAKEMDHTADFYNDGKPCTLDFCDGGEPKNEPYADGAKCPEVGAGVCSQGECVECIDGQVPCPQNGDVCDDIYCVPSACVQNFQCGTGCRPCFPLFGPCAGPDDCVEKVCVDGKCAIPTCQDGVPNDGETGTDCGSANCANKCPDGEGCAFHDDCISGVCWGAVCQAPTCKDGVQNGEEGGIDCGASCPLACKAKKMILDSDLRGNL